MWRNFVKNALREPLSNHRRNCPLIVQLSFPEFRFRLPISSGAANGSTFKEVETAGTNPVSGLDSNLGMVVNAGFFWRLVRKVAHLFLRHFTKN